MDITLLIVLASAIIVIILSIAFFVNSRRTPKVRRPDIRPGPIQARDGVPRRAQIARNRGAARLRQNVQREESDNEEEKQSVAGAKDEGKIGAKKRAKLEAKAERKAQRETEEQQRHEKKKQMQLADEEKRKGEEKEKAEERRRENEERRIKEEQAKREHDEYLKMKEAFNVEEEGYEKGDDDQQNMLQEFVNYIKNSKVVVIEDMAAKFKLKTQATIDRISDLQKDGILTGVIDDRGKFIYVSQQEMEAVAKFIKQRGRVSITELAENSNKLINLTPSVVE